MLSKKGFSSDIQFIKTLTNQLLSAGGHIIRRKIADNKFLPTIFLQTCKSTTLVGNLRSACNSTPYQLKLYSRKLSLNRKSNFEAFKPWSFCFVRFVLTNKLYLQNHPLRRLKKNSSQKIPLKPQILKSWLESF